VNTKKLLPLSSGKQACAVHLIRKKPINPPNKKKNSHNQRTRTDSHQHAWDFRVLCRCQIGDWDMRDLCLVIMIPCADIKEIWDYKLSPKSRDQKYTSCLPEVIPFTSMIWLQIHITHAKGRIWPLHVLLFPQCCVKSFIDTSPSPQNV